VETTGSTGKSNLTKEQKKESYLKLKGKLDDIISQNDRIDSDALTAMH